MKIEIEIPDELFLKGALLANRLDITLRELFGRALSEYVKGCEATVQDSRPADDLVQEALDAVYSQEDSSVGNVLAKMQWASLPVVQPRQDPTSNNPHPYCLCGCGAENTPGSRFKPGHDKILESVIEQVKSGEKVPPRVLIEAVKKYPELEVIKNKYTAEEILSIAGTWVMQNCEILWVSLPEPSGFGPDYHKAVLLIQDN